MTSKQNMNERNISYALTVCTYITSFNMVNMAGHGGLCL